FFPIREAINLLLPRLRFIVSLNLGDRNLWDGGLPDDLSGLSSLQELDLSKNNFTRLPDSISQLSKLKSLTLSDCSRLQSFANLPLSLHEDVLYWKSIQISLFYGLRVKQGSLWLIVTTKWMRTELHPSDIIEGPCISCGHISISEALSKGVNGPLFYASSYGVSVLIPAERLRDHLKDCSCISAVIRKKCTFIEIETCGARVQYKQELVKFIHASGEMKQRSKCHLDKVESSRLRPLVCDISEYIPEPLRRASSFSFKFFFQAWQLRDHLKECSWISTLITSDSPYVQIQMCGAGVVYKQDLEKFVQAEGKIKQRSQFQMDKVESSQSNDRLKEKLMMPQPMPVLQPSIENIADGCTSSETSPSSFTGFLVTTRKEQYASIMSSESLIKARLEKNFDEGEIFNCCFAEREIPLWFCYEDKQSTKIPLYPKSVNDPDWMGFALCGLFSFNRHPTAVRQSLGSIGIEFFEFRCHFQTSSCYPRLVCYGLLTTDNELVTLNQRAFIWVMFIPRTTHAHLWSKSAWAEFLLDSAEPDLLVQSFGVNLVFRHNMEELTQLLVQCSAPFGSFLDSCDPRVFCEIWDEYPVLFTGTKNSYEDLHPQRLFISQDETSVTAQYSYEEDSYPHNRFRLEDLHGFSLPNTNVKDPGF
ncbi:tmv resistance protein n, partial [Quercus suber]